MDGEDQGGDGDGTAYLQHNIAFSLLALLGGFLKKGRKNKYYETKNLVIWLDAIPSTTTGHSKN